MRVKKIKQPRPAPGTKLVGVLLPEDLHRAMRMIRQARRMREKSDVRLCRIYAEAIEQYISSERQQELLASQSKRLRRSA